MTDIHTYITCICAHGRLGAKAAFVLIHIRRGDQSAPMAVQPSKTGANQVSARIRKQIAANHSTIIEKTKDSLELHMFVLDAIADYESAKKTAADEGKQVSELGKRTRTASSDANCMEFDEAEHIAYFNTGVFSRRLPRNCANYKVWGENILAELLHYVCPLKFHLPMLRTVAGNGSHTTGGVLNAEVIFTSLKAVYEKNGRLLDNATVLAGCVIDYTAPGAGHFSIDTTSQGGDVVYKVTCKTLNKNVPIPADLLGDFDRVLHTADIKYNYSRSRAEVDLDPPLLLQNLFPMLGRLLKKRKTEEGATCRGKPARRHRGGLLGAAVAGSLVARSGSSAKPAADGDKANPPAALSEGASASQASPGNIATVGGTNTVRPGSHPPQQVGQVPPPPDSDSEKYGADLGRVLAAACRAGHAQARASGRPVAAPRAVLIAPCVAWADAVRHQRSRPAASDRPVSPALCDQRSAA